MQALDEGMGFTVVLDGAKGRYPLRVREKGHWYALVSKSVGKEGFARACVRKYRCARLKRRRMNSRASDGQIRLKSTLLLIFQLKQNKQDPGYPHGADEYRLPPSFSSAKTGGKRRKEGEEGRRGRARGGAGVGQQRVLLNLSYVRKDFPTELRQHVVTHLYYYKQHLAPAELRRGAVAAGGK